MRNGKSSTPPPRARLQDNLKIERIRHAFGNRDDAITSQIVEVLNRMGGVGSDAEVRYQEGLDSLRRGGAGVLSHIGELYRGLSPHAYLHRWSLVQLTSDLRDAQALPLLTEILAAPIPEELSKRSAEYSTVADETIIRTTAVEALARLASGGNADATHVLFRQIHHASYSVRRAAVQAILEAGDSGAREQLRKAMPASDHHLLDLRRVRVEEVPQPHVDSRGQKRDPNSLPPRERK